MKTLEQITQLVWTNIACGSEKYGGLTKAEIRRYLVANPNASRSYVRAGHIRFIYC